MNDGFDQEKDAITALKAGNLAGLDFLVSKYYAQAVRMAFWIVQDQQTAEDLAQDAFVHAASKINQLKSDRFMPWFGRSIINRALREAKKRSRFEPLEDGTEAEAQAGSPLSSAEALRSVEALLERSQKAETVRRQIAGLNPNQRAVIVMRYYLEMPVSEIVKLAGRPRTTVKWWLASALAKLRKGKGSLKG